MSKFDLLPGYGWDPRVNRYVSLSTRKFVSRQRIQELLEQQTDQRERELARLVQGLLRGEIAPAVWVSQVALEIKRMNLQFAALGAGGWDRLTARDYGFVGQTLRDDYRRLVSFAADIVQGMSEAEALHRMSMYVGRARMHFYRSERERIQPSRSDHVVLERRILNARESCEDCVRMARAGLQRVGTLPLPGQGSTCATACRCTLERIEVPTAQADALITEPAPVWTGSERVTRQADLYNPYHDERGRFTTRGRAMTARYRNTRLPEAPRGNMGGTAVNDARGLLNRLGFDLPDEMAQQLRRTMETANIPAEHYSGLDRVTTRFDAYYMGRLGFRQTASGDWVDDKGVICGAYIGGKLGDYRVVIHPKFVNSKAVLAHEVGHHVVSGRDAVDVSVLRGRSGQAYQSALSVAKRLGITQADIERGEAAVATERRLFRLLGLRSYSLTSAEEFITDTYVVAVRGSWRQRRNLARLWGVNDLPELFPLKGVNR